MDKNAITNLLISKKEYLQKRGFLHVSIFGACAHGEDVDKTEPIDLLTTLRPESRVDLIDLVETEEYLGSLLARQVRLTTAPITKEELKDEIEKDALHVF